MKLTMITGLATMLLLAISCKKENAFVTNKTSAPALATDTNETGKYTSINIRGQKWMTTNLAVTHYRNGDPVPHIQDARKWSKLTTGAWCWYNNDSATGAVYGKLYNWYAVHDPRGLAPAGWHIPSEAEWDTLSAHFGGDRKAGGKLKDTGTIQAGTGLWRDPNGNATNKSGFTGLPGGVRDYDNGLFYNIGLYGYWWSSTEDNNSYAFGCELYYLNGRFFRYNLIKGGGFSVRCIRDN
jgi:uncharacterized protein (TIGR02145 family)